MIDKHDLYGTKERQLELLLMMQDIHEILRKSNIQYSLCGGTLLGAVREKGFIPWDDDIDIMVDRENFNKIISLFHKEANLKYRLKDYLWVRRIQKKDEKREGLLAATIDVFVMDNCPDNKILQEIKVLMIKILQGMMKVDKNNAKVNLFYKTCLVITKCMGSFFAEDTKLRWYDCVSQIGNNAVTQYLGIYNDLFKYVKLKYSNRMFDKLIDVPFENLMLPITAEYDNYLTTVYGDYMTPPKEKERRPMHLNKH